MLRRVGVSVSLSLLLFFGCGGSSGGSPDNFGAFSLNGSGPNSSGLGGPRDIGPGSGNPTNFTPGGSSPNSPTPTTSPTPSLLGLYVRAGATGDGSENNPGGSLGAALAVARSGETVTILYSPDPISFGGDLNPLRLTIPDGVNLVGIPDPGGALPAVRGLFRVGSNVRLSNFAHSRFVPTGNFDLTGSTNVTFEGMDITGDLILDEVNGLIEFVDCDLNGVYSYVGQISSGTAHIVVDDCRTTGTVFNLTSNGVGTVMNVDILDSTRQSDTAIDYRTGSTGNVRIENNTLSYPSRNYVDHYDGSSGNVTFSGNTILSNPANLGGGGLNFRSHNTGSSGTIMARNNMATNCNGRIFDAIIDHGIYDLLALDNTSIYTTTTTATTGLNISAWVSNSARVRFLAQDNTLTRSINLQVQNTAQVDVGYFNNDVGLSTDQFSGLFIRTMPVGFTGSVTAAMQGNTIGTASASGQITVTTGAGMISIERLAALSTDNIIVGIGAFVETQQSGANPATNATTGPSLPPIP